MGYPAYLATNRLSALATLTASTIDASPDYGLASLYDRLLCQPFRWTSAAGGWIEADLVTAQAVSAVALMGHNFKPAAVVTLKGGDTPDPVNVIAVLTYRELCMYASFPEVSYRYWRLVVVDANDQASEIGELVLGPLVTLSLAPRWDYGLGIEETKTRHKSGGGVDYVYDRYNQEVRELGWKPRSDAQLAELRALHDAVHGSAYPFVWIPRSDPECWYMRKEDSFLPRSIGRHVYEYRMTLAHESFGEEILA